MSLTLSAIRSTLQHGRLQSPDIIFWFQHTAFPVLATRKHPNNYMQCKWDQLKERRLTGITAGFAAKGDALEYGFSPIDLEPPHIEALREIRVVRFMPDSGEVSFESVKDQDSSFCVMTVNCKMKSVSVVGTIGDRNESERETRVDELFNVQITLHSRKIEF